MNFSRAFRKNVWLVLLSSGEVEVYRGSDLETAFRCGLVDARTPVRATAESAWIHLGALLAADVEPDSASLSPTAIEVPEVNESTLVRAGSAYDMETFAPRRRGARAVAGLVGAIGALCVLFGVASSSASAKQAAAAQPAAPHGPKSAIELEPVRERFARFGRATARANIREQKRLADEEAVRAWKQAIRHRQHTKS